MRTRSAIEFCGIWEQLNNPDFKGIEFDAFKNESGSNSFALTPQKWIDSTNAKGIISNKIAISQMTSLLNNEKNNRFVPLKLII